MFYSLELLQKRGGQFGIIWVAATEGAKLNKREITGVRLKKACNDIIDYIMVRGHHQYGTGKSRKRFSLYLSSQLMYGVVKIYNRQNDYLLTDATTFMARLRFASLAKADIELRETVNSDLVTLPDPTHITDPENENFEATFGRLSSNYQESMFAHERLRFTSSSSDMDEILSPIEDINIASFRPEDIMGSSPHTVSSLEEITLKQAPLQSHLSTMLTIDEELFGLPDIIDQVPEILGSVDVPTDQSAEARPVSPIRPHTPLQTTTTEVPIIPVHETPIHRSGVDITIGGRDKRKRHKSPEVTPGHKESRLERRERKRSRQQLVLDEIEMPPPIHRPRKRRRLIIDKETQVSKEDLKKNLQNPNTSLPFVLPDLKAKTFADYLKQPGRPLCKPLLRLYQRNCKLPRNVVLSESEYSSSSLTSSSPPTGTSVSSPTTHPQVPSSPRLLPSSPRILPSSPPFDLRQTSELGQETSPGKSYSMEGIRLDTSGNISTERPVSFSRSSIDGSLIFEQSKLPETSVSRLGEVSVVIEEEDLLEGRDAEIPEPTEQLLESPLETDKQESPRKFIRQLRLSTANGQETTFRELVPPESTTRPVAARLFARLLELCKNGQVAARQERPYGDITITQIQVF